MAVTTSVWRYLPILKWKQGERRALQELSATQWEKLVPVLELPGVRAAPDLAALRAALPAYVAKVRKEVDKAIPEHRPVAIDARWVAPSYANQLRLLRILCNALEQDSDRRIIPVLTESIANGAVELARFATFPEVMLRLNVQGIGLSQVGAAVDELHKAGLPRRSVHLVLDQQSIVNDDPATRFVALCPYVDEALKCSVASVTVTGGSFPVNLMGMKHGRHRLARVEWQIWRRLVPIPAYASLRYGDYTVTNPGPVPDMDPAQVNPSVAIRYAAATEWHVFKAGGFKKGPPDQYRSLCTVLITDPVYAGPTFSFGDACYDAAARGLMSNGNPSSWRRDATSHHLVFTASML